MQTGDASTCMRTTAHITHILLLRNKMPRVWLLTETHTWVVNLLSALCTAQVLITELNCVTSQDGYVLTSAPIPEPWYMWHTHIRFKKVWKTHTSPHSKLTTTRHSLTTKCMHPGLRVEFMSTHKYAQNRIKTHISELPVRPSYFKKKENEQKVRESWQWQISA